jgi:hypothetical protein
VARLQSSTATAIDLAKYGQPFRQGIVTGPAASGCDPLDPD